MIHSRPLAALTVLFAVAGCGTSNKPPVRTFPVEGRVLVGGVPAPFVHIVFYPLESIATPSFLPVATSDAEGRFRLTTFQTYDGAPAGDYSVTVLWPNETKPFDECIDPAPHDRLMGAYTNAAAKKLRVAVKPSDNHIELKLTVGTRGWDFTPKAKGENR